MLEKREPGREESNYRGWRYPENLGTKDEDPTNFVLKRVMMSSLLVCGGGPGQVGRKWGKDVHLHFRKGGKMIIYISGVGEIVNAIFVI